MSTGERTGQVEGRAKIINFAVFQGGWFACVGGAAYGMPWLGPVYVAAAVLLQARFLGRPTPGQIRFVALGFLIGSSIDTGMALAGIYTPSRALMPWPVAPVWIMALWVIFTDSFSLSLGWLRRRYLAACLLGGLGGPSSYAAGERLGACTIQPDFFHGLGALGLVWGIAIPLLFRLYEAVGAPDDAPLARTASYGEQHATSEE